MENYIRFDWAMKRLLRNKANYAVLEGLLTTLLEEKVTIHKLLESESNQEDEFDKYNRVDMLAENSKGELVLIEVQNNNEYAYFQRMLFGASKLVTEYINRGEGYEKVRTWKGFRISRKNGVRGYPQRRHPGVESVPEADIQGGQGKPALS